MMTTIKLQQLPKAAPPFSFLPVWSFFPYTDRNQLHRLTNNILPHDPQTSHDDYHQTATTPQSSSSFLFSSGVVFFSVYRSESTAPFNKQHSAPRPSNQS